MESQVTFEIELPATEKQPTELQTVELVDQPSPHVSKEIVTEQVDMTLQQPTVETQVAFQVELPATEKQPKEIQTVTIVEQPSPHVSTEIVTERVDMTIEQVPVVQEEISLVLKGI